MKMTMVEGVNIVMMMLMLMRREERKEEEMDVDNYDNGYFCVGDNDGNGCFSGGDLMMIMVVSVLVTTIVVMSVILMLMVIAVSVFSVMK